MGIAYVKQLVHEDGEAFVIWHPTLEVYCPVLCDEDAPPAPETLDLSLDPESAFDVAKLRWFRTGASYDTHTGEILSSPY